MVFSVEREEGMVRRWMCMMVLRGGYDGHTQGSDDVHE